MTETSSHAPRCLCVRRTPRACHGGCDRLRPGSLRASHAVCLRGSTLEPALCARKNVSADESLSTTGTITKQSLPMRGDSQNSNSEASIARSSDSRFHAASQNPPRSQSTQNKRRTMALQRTAPGGSACHAGCFRLRLSTTMQPARHAAPPSAVSELESLGGARTSCE